MKRTLMKKIARFRLSACCDGWSAYWMWRIVQYILSDIGEFN